MQPSTKLGRELGKLGREPGKPRWVRGKLGREPGKPRLMWGKMRCARPCCAS